MERLALNVILRTVFGAEGPALEQLRQLLPPLSSPARFGHRSHFAMQPQPPLSL